MQPLIDQMTSLEKDGEIKGIIVTLRAKEGEDYDFYSRYFAPWVGIDEDPVTGSAHTVLAPYWQKKLNKTTFKGWYIKSTRELKSMKNFDIYFD